MMHPFVLRTAPIFAALSAVLAASPATAQTPAFSVSGELTADGTIDDQFVLPDFAVTIWDDGVEVDLIPFFVVADSQVQIDVLSFGAFSTYADSEIRLYADDGAPLTGANLIASNQDTPVGADLNGSVDDEDSFLDVFLPAGRYVLAIGARELTDAEAEAGESDGFLFAPPGSTPPVSTGEYTVDFYGDSIGENLVTNVTQGTQFTSIAAAINDAGRGDELELDAGVYYERGLVLNDKYLGIRGAGEDLTIIDGGDIDGAVFSHRNGDRSVVEHLTIRNAFRDGVAAIGPAAEIFGGSGPTYRNVTVRDNRSTGFSAGFSVDGGGNTLIDRCRFINNAAIALSARGDLTVGSGARCTVINSVFIGTRLAPGGLDIPRGSSIIVSDTGGGRAICEVINCTFADNPGVDRAIRAVDDSVTVDIVNCVFDPDMSQPILAPSSVAVSITRSVHPDLTGDNTAAAAVFVDRAGGDYRLAPGSPGIDTGDFAAYVAAGGGAVDLAGVARFFDNPTVPNGANNGAAIDAGAFELEASVDPDDCLADLNDDGILDLTDVNLFVTGFTAGCD